MTTTTQKKESPGVTQGSPTTTDAYEARPTAIVHERATKWNLDDLVHQPDARGCRLWRGHVNSAGYGKLRVDGEQVLAHRHVWEVANGRAVPDGMLVLHGCDVRRCCEPSHLSLGTCADNARQMWARGRGHPNSVEALRSASRRRRGVA